MCGYVVMWCGVLVMESMPYCVLTSMISNINIVYHTTQNLGGIKFKVNCRFWISMSRKVCRFGILAMVIFCEQKVKLLFHIREYHYIDLCLSDVLNFSLLVKFVSLVNLV